MKTFSTFITDAGTTACDVMVDDPDAPQGSRAWPSATTTAPGS